jgi:hypothetical protein
MAASKRTPAKTSNIRRLPVARQLLLRVTLTRIEPAIWRRVVIPEALTLEQLHRVIQCAFSWLDYHLYEFRVGDRRFQRPEDESEGESAEQTPLTALGLEAGARLTYVYDFGDDWEHEIVVEEVAPLPPADDFDWFPRILDGERAGPPEDVGGIPGYEEFLAAFKNPKHPEHGERRAWAEPGFDPQRFDLAAADHALALMCAWGAI